MVTQTSKLYKEQLCLHVEENQINVNLFIGNGQLTVDVDFRNQMK